MPAVLIEGGFISNQEERTQLRTREFQDKIARGIADGIDAYFRKR
jgi:N-acetylmuramoyl-L-alanine amidase